MLYIIIYKPQKFNFGVHILMEKVTRNIHNVTWASSGVP